MNLYTPERQSNESREQYAQRRRIAKQQAQALEQAHIFGQRRAPSTRERLRDSQRASGEGPRPTFADFICAEAARKRARAL